MPAIIPIPAFSDNYIWLVRQECTVVAVDPGAAAPVREWLARERLELAAILVTHHHHDHVGGVEALAGEAGIPVLGPAAEVIPRRTRGLAEGDSVALPDLGLAGHVLDVPGHTAGHIAYVFDDIDGRPCAFVGDTLFAGGCGRLFEGTAAQMTDSLAKLAALPDATRVYCAHEYTVANLRFALAVEPGNAELQRRSRRVSELRAQGLPTVPSTIAEERATNPFLRTSEPEVIAAAERHAGHALDGTVATFATLRNWKNTFA